ncbi:MAG: hypothetical protein EZS28_026425 [Streblomastix strix]|uniref:Uncharacterized protein n=1 Tax=Streblomastix strix TaxID=222440 RepID=A0A5J4V5P3_9EUKA|nr:MAG: hypothetical protein EZS28_026425 [Streblomastix strix]
MKSPTIPEVELQFEKEIVAQIDPFQQSFQQPIQQLVTKYETPTLSARSRSSISEDTLTADLSVCRWLLDVISEDEHMVKESVHFVLSENQLIRVVAYTFDVPESLVQLVIEDEGYCSRFCSDSTQTLNEILIGNVNILKLDVEKVNLLRDSYKICLQKIRRIIIILDLGEITSKIIGAVSKGLMTVLNKI